jgi:hypothetical protein
MVARVGAKPGTVVEFDEDTTFRDFFLGHTPVYQRISHGCDSSLLPVVCDNISGCRQLTSSVSRRVHSPNVRAVVRRERQRAALPPATCWP